jgi:hypothetical protein
MLVFATFLKFNEIHTIYTLNNIENNGTTILSQKETDSKLKIAISKRARLMVQSVVNKKQVTCISVCIQYQIQCVPVRVYIHVLIATQTVPFTMLFLFGMRQDLCCIRKHYTWLRYRTEEIIFRVLVSQTLNSVGIC